jgi:FkbM family methyltransferase
VYLGAGIGFTSLYLARRLDATVAVAVEPDPANVVILRRNLEQDDVHAIVVDAAVSHFDGQAFLRLDRAGLRFGLPDTEDRPRAGLDRTLQVHHGASRSRRFSNSCLRGSLG